MRLQQAQLILGGLLFVSLGSAQEMVTEDAKVTPEPPSFGDAFGQSVALSGNTLVVGAPSHDQGAGSVFVYVREGSGWRQEAALSPGVGRSFGSEVAVFGDRIAVCSDVGHRVYTYWRQDGVWAEEAKIERRRDGFGNALALTRDQLLVGAFGQDTPAGVHAGAVFVYTAGFAGWNLEQRLVASDASDGDRFGWALAVHDSTLIVGSIGDDHAGGVDAGSAYVFARGPFGWNETSKLVPGEAAYRFGHSVAVSGDRLAVLAWKNELTINGRGFGSVFARSGDAWEPEAVLRVQNVSFSRLALSGDTALLSAGGQHPPQGFLFRREGTAWVESAGLVPSVPQPWHWARFGAEVALNGKTAVITAPEESILTFSGAAFVYRVPEELVRRR